MLSISIIIPVYQVDKYIEVCLDSILVQSISNFELILVDDGSIDKSGILCDEFTLRDTRVIVCHRKNSGVSSARNLGMNCANGEQIFFVDGDDTIDSDYIQNLLIVGNEDIVQGDCKVLENEYLKPFMTHEDIIADFGRYWTESGSFSCWGKCFKKQFLYDYQIFFENEFDYGEDERFVMKGLQFANSIRRVGYCGYNYNSNVDSSAMKQLKVNRLELEQDICERLESVIKDDNSCMRIRWLGWHYILNHFYYFLNFSEKKNERKIIRKKIKKTYKSVFFRKSIKSIKKIGSLDEIIEANLMGYYLHRLYKPILKIIQKLSSIKNRRF